MATMNYKEKVQNLNDAINIAIEVFHTNPPKGFDKNNINQLINSYLDFKNDVLNPKPEFENSKSLKYLENDVFTYFQETEGNTTNIFWKKIKEKELPYKRQNKLSKILKRKKIKNEIEYNFIIDILVPYQDEGLIDKDDTLLLKKIISDFEKNKRS